ncbi:hypothetical protein niasHT_023616 [Heterodera trifolii]|uniref:Uncharacterized protein n=1 Tax=Heterodera trifolii TaxID=157864 RepID=A0ABD2JK79_9BILA
MLGGAFTSAVVAPGAPIGIVPLSSGVGGGTDVGDGDGGAYEYPLIEETDPFGGAPEPRLQQEQTFAGQSYGRTAKLANLPNYGVGGKEEWEDEMVGEGRTEMGQIERGGGMPFWIGGTMVEGETTDGTRTDSEEQQRYSQYLVDHT